MEDKQGLPSANTSYSKIFLVCTGRGRELQHPLYWSTRNGASPQEIEVPKTH